MFRFVSAVDSCVGVIVLTVRVALIFVIVLVLVSLKTLNISKTWPSRKVKQLFNSRLTLCTLVSKNVNTIIALLIDDVTLIIHLKHVICSSLVRNLTMVKLNVIANTAVRVPCHVDAQSGVLGKEPAPQSRLWVSTVLLWGFCTFKLEFGGLRWSCSSHKSSLAIRITLENIFFHF